MTKEEFLKLDALALCKHNCLKGFKHAKEVGVDINLDDFQIEDYDKKDFDWIEYKYKELVFKTYKNSCSLWTDNGFRLIYKENANGSWIHHEYSPNYKNYEDKETKTYTMTRSDGSWEKTEITVEGKATITRNTQSKGFWWQETCTKDGVTKFEDSTGFLEEIFCNEDGKVAYRVFNDGKVEREIEGKTIIWKNGKIISQIKM